MCIWSLNVCDLTMCCTLAHMLGRHNKEMVSETKKSCMDTNSWVSNQTWLAYEEDKYHCKSNKTQYV